MTTNFKTKYMLHVNIELRENIAHALLRVSESDSIRTNLQTKWFSVWFCLPKWVWFGFE